LPIVNTTTTTDPVDKNVEVNGTASLVDAISLTNATSTDLLKGNVTDGPLNIDSKTVEVISSLENSTQEGNQTIENSTKTLDILPLTNNTTVIGNDSIPLVNTITSINDNSTIAITNTSSTSINDEK